MLENGKSLAAVEAKPGSTFHLDHALDLDKFTTAAGPDLTRSVVVYDGAEAFAFKEVSVVPWTGAAL